MNTVAPLPPEVKLTMQGGLVQAHIKQVAPRRGGGKRGAVNAFTAAARRRLMKLLARMNPDRALFLTLTYPADYPNPRKAKAHLLAFNKRMLRLFPAYSCVWRHELQERGAPHFHLILFGVGYIGKKVIQRAWGDIIGYPDVFTRIESVRTRRKLMAYVSKYVAKVVGGGSPPGGFNIGAYLAADGWVRCSTGEIECTVGRWWGTFNAAALPFAEAFEVVLDTLKVFHQMRRGARHIWSGVGRKKEVGFSLFVEAADRWVDYFFAICTGAA